MFLSNDELIDLVKAIKSGKVDESNVFEFTARQKLKTSKKKEITFAGFSAFVSHFAKEHGLNFEIYKNQSVQIIGDPVEIASAVKDIIKNYGYEKVDFDNTRYITKSGRGYILNNWKKDGDIYKKKVAKNTIELNIDDIEKTQGEYIFLCPKKA